MIEIQFKQTAIHPNPELNFLPKKAHENDAAFDLFSSEEITLLPWETRAIPTGLQLADIKITDNVSRFLKIEGRSGLALKRIVPTGGIIDISYRGEIKCIMNNNSNQPYTFKIGDKIAQLLIYKIDALPSEVSLSFTETISETSRGQKGFGSSGV